MYTTMIQYVQSRGRARQRNSKFIHMLERGNPAHEQRLREVRAQEKAMQRFCQALPEDRRLQGDEDNLEVLMEREKTLRVYTEPLTGAKLTYGNALVCRLYLGPRSRHALTDTCFLSYRYALPTSYRQSHHR